MDVVRLVLVVFVLLVASAQLSAQQAPPEDRIDFDLSTETHADLYNKLSTYLRQTSTPPFDPPDVQGRFVLGPRRPDFYDEPLRWIMLHVRVDGATETTLAIAHDDLYVLGFSNSAGHWYKLSGNTGQFQGLPGSTILGIKENYADLLGLPLDTSNAHLFLTTVPLGKQSAIGAARTLAGYNPGTTTDDDVRRAMVRFAVMISEAMRFTVIRQEFSERWEEETHITKQQASYVTCWSKLSYLLLNWARGKGWTGTKGLAKVVRKATGVEGASQALAVLDFLGRPKPPSAPPPAAEYYYS